MNYDDTAAGFLPGCYTSLRRQNYDPDLHRTCAYPRIYNEFADVKPREQEPRWLFSFAGSIRSHPVRRLLVERLRRDPASLVLPVEQPFHSHTAKQKRAYVDQILASKFVLCPRGHSPSTYRLFEAMQMGRCPVIISDDWVPIQEVVWNECSILVPEQDVNKIPEILREAEPQWKMLGDTARRVYQERFAPSVKFKGYLQMIRALQTSIDQSGYSMDSNDMMRRWRSWTFRWRNEWTLPQKVARRFAH